MEKGSSSGDGGSGDKLKGLQFGGKIHFEGASGDGSSSKSVNTPALTEVRLAAAGKKAKGAAQGFGLPPPPPPKCQVEGCNLDLKGAKSYHCRHKVCGTHSKSPKVIVAGLEQRFCQQCSRFHLLKEFDQGKRSCRRRLAGHNERRRKPPPPELLPPRCDQLSSFPEEKSSCHNGYLMDFMHPRPPEAKRENISWRSLRLNDLLSASELALGECIAGVSDSTCALSLLSNHLLGEAPASTSSAMPIDQQSPLIVPSVEIEATRANIASSYLDSSQGFTDHEAGSSSSHEMEPRQIHDAEIDQFSSIGIGPSEVYDHLHDFHWLL